MTISSSMNAGVAGLSANATRLGTISDNIANSGTYGYKRVETDFSSMVLGGVGGTYAAGGVRSNAHRLVDQNGSLVGTNNATDIAVRGVGFIPVASAGEIYADVENPTMMLTTTGSFRPDAEGYLRTESGLILQAWPADENGDVQTFPRDTPQGLQPVRMDMSSLISTPTSQIDMGVNLPATATAGDMYPLSLEYYDNMGSAQSMHAEFVFTGTPTEWTMTVFDVPGGTTLGTFDLNFFATGAEGGALESVALNGASPASGTVVGDVPTITLGTAPDDQVISLFAGTVGETDGLSQLGDEYAPLSVSRDGNSAGSMVGVEIDENGFVLANYDNGLTRVIYQVPLAALPNPNGMVALDRQTFLPSPESGSFTLWNAGTGPTGEVVAFAREESTTDVAAELTEMIVTQRAYSSNAKVIQTVDEMLQETTNIKR